MLSPPRAARRPHPLVAHGDTRQDDWYWLCHRDDPEVVAYLRAENAYADTAFAPLDDLRETLYEEIRGRIQESDVSTPARNGPWWYYGRTVEGQQYAIHCRRADPEHRLTPAEALVAAVQGDAGEVVLLDENVAASDSDYFALGMLDVSPDQSCVAYAVDLAGAERYTLRFRELTTGLDLADEITDVYYSSAWSADSQSFFYVRPDHAVRPWQVWRHQMGQPVTEDVLVFQEDDERFFVSVGLTRSERFILVATESKVTTEVHLLDAGHPVGALRVVEPRRHGVEYSIDHAVLPGDGDVLLILTNDDGADNFALLRAPAADPGRANWQTVIPQRPEVRLESVDAFAGHFVVTEREQALERIRVVRLADGDDRVVPQPEPLYSLGAGANLEWTATTLRFGYTSLVTPPSAVDYDVVDGERVVVKQQAVLGPFDPAAYQTDRLWAEAPDGTHVPISLVHRRDVPQDGSAPCLLYGYGAYEVTIDPTFSSVRLNLVDRGFVFAIAHIRGGGELGRPWYEDGKLLQKRNTFTDFIACAEHLVATGYTSAQRLVIRGGSAGGLLMGAVTNMRPDLWRAVVAEVPFVDCLTTMQDVTLPLTVTEWDEWGNPVDDAAAYDYIKSYSPYDNIEATDYPAIYVTAGLNDPRVGFWEPAKWVAKLRASRSDDDVLVLKTEMDAGHGGPSGRYDAWRDEAQVHAFMLAAVGLAPALAP